MAIFETHLRVDITKVDGNAQITSKGILDLLENAASMHSDIAGFGIKDIPNNRLSWIQLNWRVKVLRRLSYGEEVTIKTWTSPPTKVTTFRDFEVLDSENKQVCVATTKYTLINIDTLSIQKISDEIIDKYGPVNKSILPDYEFKKLKEPSSFSNEYIYKTLRRDIDVNKHVHNSIYLDLAYEALPENIYENNCFNNIEIMYKSSIRLGDTSKCLYSYEDGKHIVTIKSLDDKTLHSIIRLW